MLLGQAKGVYKSYQEGLLTAEDAVAELGEFVENIIEVCDICSHKDKKPDEEPCRDCGGMQYNINIE